MVAKKFRRWFCELALLVLLLGTLWGQTAGGAVGASQDQAAQSRTPAGEDTRATQETTVSSKEAKELFRSVDEILQFASQDTGLPIKHKVKRRLTKRDEVQSYIEKSMKDDKDAKRLERSSAVLKKFGLLPRNFDLPNFLVAMLREQVAGYYDVKTKTVNLLNWVDVEQQKPVLAHELTHALQDQSFGIEKWMKGSKEDIDKKDDPSPDDVAGDEESAARQAVVEGQAMVVLLDYSLAPTGKTLQESPQIVEALKQGMLVGTADSPTFRDAPIFLKEELTFPYRYGLDFTAALLQAGGKELAYAGAFKDPPKTTREIMEPETYLAHEKLEPLKGDKSAPIGVLYVSRWSSAAKAAEFAAVYAKSLAKRYQKRQGLGGDGKVAEDAPPADSWRTLRGRHAWMTEEGVVMIEVRGDTVLISESLDDATTKKVEEDFWPEEKAAPVKP